MTAATTAATTATATAAPTGLSADDAREISLAAGLDGRDWAFTVRANGHHPERRVLVRGGDDRPGSVHVLDPRGVHRVLKRGELQWYLAAGEWAPVTPTG
jgi:hypothetical protein